MKERKEKLVAVRLPLSLCSVLFKEAERRGLTISHVVREVLTLTLVEENHEIKAKQRCQDNAPH